jgi:predicted alpha/beta hydrolase family esterase
MRTIILPGYSAHNRAWADEIAAELAGGEVHDWPHWESGGTFDATRELAAIKNRIGDDTVHLLAKSIGCRIAAQIVLDRAEQIDRLMLCGLPTTQVEAQADFAAALSRLPVKRILVVQNRHDPYASHAEVQNMIQSIHPGVKVVEGDRADHHYPYPKIFREFFEH